MLLDRINMLPNSLYEIVGVFVLCFIIAIGTPLALYLANKEDDNERH